MNPYQSPNSQQSKQSSNRIVNDHQFRLGLLPFAVGVVLACVLNFFGIMAADFFDISLTRVYQFYAFIIPVIVTTFVVSAQNYFKNLRPWQLPTYGLIGGLLIAFSRWLLL